MKKIKKIKRYTPLTLEKILGKDWKKKFEVNDWKLEKIHKEIQ